MLTFISKTMKKSKKKKSDFDNSYEVFQIEYRLVGIQFKI